MSKVLTGDCKKKRPSRKAIDLLSSLVICVTIASLFLLTFSPRQETGETIEASGFAIYKGEPQEPAVALMFNVYEGTEEVVQILDILRKYSAKATFFIGGIWAEKNPETVLEIKLAGHEIGTHGYLHKDHATLSVEQNKEEIAISARLLERITGDCVHLFAPPSGSFDEKTESACKSLGMKMILWTKDTIDWRDNDPTVICKRATKSPESGALILMHPKEQTVLALPNIIETYQSAGYALLTVGEVIS